AVNGRVYALGGLPGAPTDLATAEGYDPTTDTWTTLPSMPTARAGLAVVGVDSSQPCGGYLYALGGGWLTYTAAVERYNPATNTWSTLSPLTQARRSLGATFSLNGAQIVTSGGWNDYYVPTTEGLGCGVNGPTPTPTPNGGAPTATPRPAPTSSPTPCA